MKGKISIIMFDIRKIQEQVISGAVKAKAMKKQPLILSMEELPKAECPAAQYPLAELPAVQYTAECPLAELPAVQ